MRVVIELDPICFQSFGVVIIVSSEGYLSGFGRYLQSIGQFYDQYGLLWAPKAVVQDVRYGLRFVRLRPSCGSYRFSVLAIEEVIVTLQRHFFNYYY